MTLGIHHHSFTGGSFPLAVIISFIFPLLTLPQPNSSIRSLECRELVASTENRGRVFFSDGEEIAFTCVFARCRGVITRGGCSDAGRCGVGEAMRPCFVQRCGGQPSFT